MVEDAQSVEVQLRDERAFPAHVVASDEPSDIAVLKIPATDLPALPWGNSDKVEVGEQVFAIGNPFDLDNSVSKGIVSAKGRNLPESTSYEDYIQTDAAINPGNSGGPLINIHGELIGINAAIASYNRVNDGVGFSIPSNLVRYAVEGLLKDGKLTRGYLGVRLPTKIDGGVAEQLGLEANKGALLAGVQRSSPADMAKLRPVDFITGVDGHKIDSVAQLRLIVAQIPIGKQVAVNFIRAGEAQSTTVKIAELPKDSDAPAPMPQLDAAADPDLPSAPPADHVLNGLQVTDLNDKSRQKFGIDETITSGVVVTGVAEGSPADTRGLVRGDVIEIACARRGVDPASGQCERFHRAGEEAEGGPKRGAPRSPRPNERAGGSVEHLHVFGTAGEVGLYPPPPIFRIGLIFAIGFIGPKRPIPAPGARTTPLSRPPQPSRPPSAPACGTWTGASARSCTRADLGSFSRSAPLVARRSMI